MRTNSLRSFFFVCLLFVCFCPDAVAQSYLYATGNPSFATNIPIENGFINLSNGNLHMEFSLATHKQRGALSLNERLVYDSRIWMIGHYSNFYWWPDNIPNTPNTQAGWRFVTGAEMGSISYSSQSSNSGPCWSQNNATDTPDGTVYNAYYSIVWSDASGTTRPFDATGYEESNSCTGHYYKSLSDGSAIDASGYSVHGDPDGNPVIVDSSGTQVYPQVIDRYGNFWTSDSNGNLVDDLGRTPVIVTKNGNVTYYDVLAPNGPVNNNGARVRYTVTTAPIAVQTAFHQPLNPSNPSAQVTEWSGTLYPVQSIQLPNGSSYTFTYDTKITGVDQTPHYGEIKSVTLPTGGVIAYGFEVFEDSFGNQNRWLRLRKEGMIQPPSLTASPPGVRVAASDVKRRLLLRDRAATKRSMNKR